MVPYKLYYKKKKGKKNKIEKEKEKDISKMSI